MYLMYVCTCRPAARERRGTCYTRPQNDLQGVQLMILVAVNPVSILFARRSISVKLLLMEGGRRVQVRLGAGHHRPRLPCARAAHILVLHICMRMLSLYN